MSSTASAAMPDEHDRAPIELPHRERIEILVAVLLGIFLAALDQTIVGTALPIIVSDLEGNDVYVWAFTAYLLTATISGPIYGKLSDIFGRRPIFLFGVACSSSARCCAASPRRCGSSCSSAASRAWVPGALFPIALAIIGDIFAPSERGKYQGFFGAVFGVSSLLGPAIGGLITDNFGWHWIFFVNLPLGAVVLYVISRTLPTRREEDADRHIDYLGAVLLVGALVPILIGFTNKQFGEWTDPDVGGLIAVGLALAGLRVRRVARTRADRAAAPLPHPHLHRQRGRLVPGGHRLLRRGRLPAALVPVRPRQLGHGIRLPDPAAARRPDHLGRRLRPDRRAGRAVQDADRRRARRHGLRPLPADEPPARYAAAAAVAVDGGHRSGVGPTFAVFTLAVQNAVPVRDLGTATSSLTLFQQVGGTVGLAIAGTIFGSTLLEETPRQLVEAGVPPEFAGQFASGDASQFNELTSVGDLGVSILAQVPEEFQAVVEPLIPAIVDGIHTAFSIATGATFVVGIVTALLAALLVAVVMPPGRIGERQQAGWRASVPKAEPALD